MLSLTKDCNDVVLPNQPLVDRKKKYAVNTIIKVRTCSSSSSSSKWQLTTTTDVFTRLLLLKRHVEVIVRTSTNHCTQNACRG